VPASPLLLPDPLPHFGRVRLRVFTDHDIPMLIDLSTDPYVPMTGLLPAHATEDDARSFIRRQHDRLVTGTAYSFCIARRDTDAAVGQAGLWLEQLTHGRAQAGYSIAPSDRGHGLASHALTALTALAWSIPDIHRIELYIEPWNAASIRAAESAGYQYEGLLRRHQVIGGKRVDMQLLAASRPVQDHPYSWDHSST